jgi:PST family polysaccharide transporter
LLSSIFWLNIILTFTISIIILFCSHIFASLFNEGRLTSILQFFVIAFISGSLISIQQALLEKKLNFRRMALLEIVSVFLGAIIGIYSAYHGEGVWSLVYQMTGASVILCILLWIQPSHWCPSIYFQWNDIRTIRSFISNLTGFTILNYFLRNADNFIIGRYLGANDLGFYNLAYKVMIVPLQNLTAVISRVMFPLFSLINKDNAAMRSVYSKIALTIAFFTFPFFACLMLISNEFVSVVFGNKWLPVARLLFILSPVGLLQSIDTTTGSLFQAKERTDIMFKWGMVTGILAVVAFYIGVQWGVYGVALGYLIATLLWTYHGFAIPLALIDQKAVGFFIKFKNIVFCVTGVYIITLFFKNILLVNCSPIERFSIVIVLMSLSYILLSYMLNRLQVKEIKNIFLLNIMANK